jgi:hypothetical protein
MDGQLPGAVQEVADVIGRERALYLVGQLPPCGKRSWRRFVSVPHPRRLKPDHQLVRILGWDDAQRLSEVFGGELLELAACSDLPRRWRDLNVRHLARQGASSAVLAHLFALSQRQIRNVING